MAADLEPRPRLDIVADPRRKAGGFRSWWSSPPGHHAAAPSIRCCIASVPERFPLLGGVPREHSVRYTECAP